MLNLKIGEAKRFFFDIEKMQKRADAMAVRAVFRQGNYLKRTAQTSMRSGGKKGKASKPGEPPRTHGRRLLRTRLFNVTFDDGKSAIIGPEKIAGTDKRNRGKTIPQTLEFGGDIDVKQRTRTVTGIVEPRPYMGPAEKKTRGKFAEQFRGQFGRAA